MRNCACSRHTTRLGCPAHRNRSYPRYLGPRPDAPQSSRRSPTGQGRRPPCPLPHLARAAVGWWPPTASTLSSAIAAVLISPADLAALALALAPTRPPEPSCALVRAAGPRGGDRLRSSAPALPSWAAPLLPRPQPRSPLVLACPGHWIPTWARASRTHAWALAWAPSVQASAI